MDYLLLGFMVTGYLKEIGFDGDTDFERVVDVVNAFVRGYIQYTKSDERGSIKVTLLTKKDNSLFVSLSKEN